MPAAAGNLTVVYNKALFDAAGIAYPGGRLGMEDFRTAAAALADPATNTYGTSWPITGDEDTVWRFWPMLWQKGGDRQPRPHRRHRSTTRPAWTPSSS